MIIILNKGNELKERLETELKQINIDESQILKKAEFSIYAINIVLKELKELICKNKFSDVNEEIQFQYRIKASHG